MNAALQGAGLNTRFLNNAGNAGGPAVAASGMSRLRTLGFIDYPDRGTVRAQPVLFLEV